MECATCGAGLSSTDERCGYCHTLTAHGQQVLLTNKRRTQEQTRRAEDQARRTKDRVGAQVDRTAQRAFSWSVKGVFVAGLPNIFLGFWAILRARKYSVAVPWRAVVALVAGFVHLGVFALAAKFAVDEYHRYEQRVEALNDEARRVRPADHLSLLSGCVLAEQQLAQAPLVGIVTRVTCSGPYAEHGDRALLQGVHISSLVEERAVVVCFERRAGGWQVAEMGDAPNCAEQMAAQPSEQRAPRPRPTPRSSSKQNRATIDRPSPALRQTP